MAPATAGAGVTCGTASGRAAGDSELPLSFEASSLTGSDLVSDAAGLMASGLPSPTLAVSLLGVSIFGASICAASLLGGSSLSTSALTGSLRGDSSPPGLPRLLSFCLADSLRPSGPRSLEAGARSEEHTSELQSRQ